MESGSVATRQIRRCARDGSGVRFRAHPPWFPFFLAASAVAGEAVEPGYIAARPFRWNASLVKPVTRVSEPGPSQSTAPPDGSSRTCSVSRGVARLVPGTVEA